MNRNISGNEGGFFGTIKEKLMQEREQLERELQDGEYYSSPSKKPERKWKSTHNNSNKKSMSYTIGVPSFLMKSNDPTWKKPIGRHIKSNMVDAMKRYEKSLEKAGSAIISSEQEREEQIKNIKRLVKL